MEAAKEAEASILKGIAAFVARFSPDEDDSAKRAARTADLIAYFRLNGLAMLNEKLWQESGQDLSAVMESSRLEREHEAEKQSMASEQEFLAKKVVRLLQSQKTTKFLRSKLIVVGEGRAGKTSLIKAFLEGEFDPQEKSTRGFDVGSMRIEYNWKKDDSHHSRLAEFIAQLADNDNETPVVDVQPERRESKVAVQVSENEVKRYGQIFLHAALDDDPVDYTSNDEMSLSVWDFGGQLVFYSLHHLFMTEYGCYLLVFNAMSLLSKDKKTKARTVNYLKFWLFSKKIHAPHAPVVIVGTHIDGVPEGSEIIINEIIEEQILGDTAFGEIRNKALSFFPVSSKTRVGVAPLRKKVEQVLHSQSFLQDQVPLSFLLLADRLYQTGKDFTTTHDTASLIQDSGLDVLLLDEALKFLNDRGLITYFKKPAELNSLIIMHPQWLINGLTCVLFDEDEHGVPKFSDNFNADFRTFKRKRFISSGLLFDIWMHQGYTPEVQQFFRSIMLTTLLICEYKFDKHLSYLVPSLFTTEEHAIIGFNKDMASSLVHTDAEFGGLFFVIDFSGDHSEEVVADHGKTFVRFMPYGIFERLIALAVSHSASYPTKRVPQLRGDCAIVTFGAEVIAKLEPCHNEQGEKLWIKVSTETGTHEDKIIELAKTIYSMVKSILEDYMSTDKKGSNLSISLLIPANEEHGFQLAEYNAVERRLADPTSVTAKTPFFSNVEHGSPVVPLNYSHWFPIVGAATAEPNIVQPDESFQKLKKKEPNLVSLQQGVFKALPDGFEYHCFLSYRQQTAVNLVGKWYFILSGKGYKCWWDQQLKTELNLEAMLEGVRKSMCYVLFLSKDIFPSYYIEQEIKTAVSLKKPIILLHHPKTGQVDYWSFRDYIDKAPEALGPVFGQVESLPLHTKYYLEESTTRVIDERLTQIINQS